jgi:ADP-heptose:LPS heptosyltransferase
MKPICLNLGDCNGLGDLICATPTIKVLSESYGQKITIVSKMPELFKMNPYVEGSYKVSSIDWQYFNANYIMHNSFYNVGKKNERGVEAHHNKMNIVNFHAIHLGFMLGKDEMECYFKPLTPLSIELPEKYIVIHSVRSWESRTWSALNWMNLTQQLNELGYSVVSIGKDSSEKGFFNVQKPTFSFEIEKGLNLMNETTISDSWHIINNAQAIVTMDSGILHLAGTTDTHIIHLGSSIKPEFRAPYRKGSQSYKYDYVRGGCGLECASNMKYALDYWDDINSIPPLIGCLEKKKTFECHPNVEQVLDTLKTIL